MFDLSQPLWLPKGSVRAVLTISAWGAWIYLMVTDAIVPAGLEALVGVVTATYFSARANGHVGGKDEKASGTDPASDPGVRVG